MITSRTVLIYTTIFLIIGLAVSILAVVIPVAEPPKEMVANALETVQTEGAINSQELEGILQSSEQIVRISSSFLQKIWQNSSFFPEVASYYHNLNVSDVPTTYDSNYEQNISRDFSAFKIAPTAFDEAYQDGYLSGNAELDPFNFISDQLEQDILKSAKIDVIWKELFDTYTDNEWINYASDNGFFRTYPFHEINDRTFDPTEEASYISAKTGSKDVIIVVDRSGSMEGSAIENSKSAIKKIILDLGATDRFNIVTFADDVKSFSNSLDVPSEEVIDDAFKFIDSIRAFGTTDFQSGIIEGLDILAKYHTTDKQPLILFLTDGVPSIGETNTNTIVENIDRENALSDSEIILFGLGDKVNASLMNEIADITSGTYIPINSTEFIDQALLGYTDFLSNDIHDNVVWSFPFLDPAGNNLVISAGIPVTVNDEFIGVMSTDINIRSLVNFLDDIKPTNNSRNFIIDVGGKTILHPEFMYKAKNEWTENNIRLPISDLETVEEDFLSLLEQAKGREQGVALIEYNDGKDYIVTLTSIGNSSMIYGVVVPITDVISQSVYDALATLSISYLSIIPGLVGGIIVAIIFIRILPNRLVDENENDEPNKTEIKEEVK